MSRVKTEVSTRTIQIYYFIEVCDGKLGLGGVRRARLEPPVERVPGGHGNERERKARDYVRDIVVPAVDRGHDEADRERQERPERLFRTAIGFEEDGHEDHRVARRKAVALVLLEDVESVVDRLRDRTSRQRSGVRQRVARADRGHEEVARVADVEHEHDYERVAGEVARGRGTAAVVEEHERPEDDRVEVVERVEERQDVRQERRRDLLERHRGVRSEERAIEGDERGVIVDRVHGADERAEAVEDHDDAADDVVVEEDGEGASGVGPPRAPGGDPDWHEGNSGHPREDRAVLEGAETEEADEEERACEDERQDVDRLPAHRRVLAHDGRRASCASLVSSRGTPRPEGSDRATC